MDNTNNIPPSNDAPRVKLTLAMDASVHSAMADAARISRRSLNAEINVAMDEHLARRTSSTEN